MTATDFAHNRLAAANRYDKAKDLAGKFWDLGLTSLQIEYTTDLQWGRLSRRTLGRTASDETRRLAQAFLLIKEAWAAANPDHPQARRTVLTDTQADALKGAPTR